MLKFDENLLALGTNMYFWLFLRRVTYKKESTPRIIDNILPQNEGCNM